MFMEKGADRMKRMREIATGKKSVRALILAMVCLVMIGMTPMMQSSHVQADEEPHAATLEECAKGNHNWEVQEGCCGKENTHDPASHSPVHWQICTVCKKIELIETGDIAPLAEIVPAESANCTSPGKTDGLKCTAWTNKETRAECGTWLISPTEIPALGHDYQDITTEEDKAEAKKHLNEQGEIPTKKCTRCGEYSEYKKEEKPSTGEIEIEFGTGTLTEEEKKIEAAKEAESKAIGKIDTDPIIIVPFKDQEEVTSYIDTVTLPKPKYLLTVYAEPYDPYNKLGNRYLPYDEKYHYIPENAKIYYEKLADPEWEVSKSAYPYIEHKFTVKNKDGCKCSVCGYVKKNGHTWTDGGAKKDRCSACGYEKNHSFQYANEKEEKCRDCGRTRAHTFVNANGGKNHRCVTCVGVTTTWVQGSHVWEDAGKKDRCKICGTKRDHDWKHMDNTNDQCGRCKKKQKHQWKDNHKKDRDECKVCHTLKNHRWTDGGKKCKCGDCGATTNHRWKGISDTTEKCSYCGKSRGHSWKNNSKKGKDECKTCGWLKAHNWKDDGKKNDKCRDCGAKTKHVKGSDGKCRHCGKKM